MAPSDAGVASATVNANQQVGGSVGVALLSTVASSSAAGFLGRSHPTQALVAAATVHGYTSAFLLSAGIFALGAIIAFAPFRPGLPIGDRGAEPALALQ